VPATLWSRPPNRFAPRLEALEHRDCPSCTVLVSGNTLRIIGDGGANAVNVTHNGAGTVTATCDGTAVTRSGIRRIFIDTRGGADTVNFSATGALTRRLDLNLRLGGGNDFADVNFAAIDDRLKLHADLGGGNDTLDVNLDQELRARSEADLHVNGGGGNDTWILSVNEVRTGAELKAHFEGDSGNDTLDVRLGDPIDAGAEVKIQATGDGGDDSLKVDATTFGTGANIAAGAELRVQLEGGDGSDSLTLSYEGDVDGEFKADLDGGSGADTAVADVTVSAGSTGDVHARVEGGSGNDSLTLRVVDQSGGAAKVRAGIDGGSGTDTCVRTTNVKVENCEA
jgi:hypothetical protein